MRLLVALLVLALMPATAAASSVVGHYRADPDQVRTARLVTTVSRDEAGRFGVRQSGAPLRGILHADQCSGTFRNPRLIVIVDVCRKVAQITYLGTGNFNVRVWR